jgi:hypothetical protein
VLPFFGAKMGMRLCVECTCASTPAQPKPLVDMTTPESAIQDKQAKQTVLAQIIQRRVILGTPITEFGISLFNICY